MIGTWMTDIHEHSVLFEGLVSKGTALDSIMFKAVQVSDERYARLQGCD